LDIPTLTELVRMIRQDPTRLGSASIGSPTHGALWGAVRLVASEGIEPTGDQPWGTDVAVRSLERAVREVRSCFDNTPRLSVGDISRERGGWLRPHRSHQSGLDADVGYYYLTGPGWFEPATAANLDRPRTWALVRALVDGGTVESIFMDVSVQRLLRDYAQQLEEDRGRLDDVFASSDKRRHDVIVQHARGHLTHFHVRFTDPASVSLGQRLAPILKVHPGAP
jgi:murein endopeptidase